MYIYKTKGVCSTAIYFDIVEGKIRSVSFKDGCNGNLKALGILLEGMDVGEAVQKLSGLHCGRRKTSCADQFTLALKQYT